MAELGTCPNQVAGIGSGGCIQPTLLKTIRAIHPAKESQSFASLADFQDEDKWKEAIFSKEIFPLIPYEESENMTTDAVEVTSSAGNIFLQEDGKYAVKFMMALTPDQNRILLTYNNKRFKFYMVDNARTIAGTSPDETSVTGFSGIITVYKRQLPFTTDTVEYSVVRIVFDDHYEFNQSPRYAIGPELEWNPLNVIKPMTKISLTPSTVTSNAFTCAFAYVDPTTGKIVPLKSVDTSVLTILEQTGSTVNITVTETSTEGTYTITDTGASMTSGSITLNATAESLFYSDTVTVEAA